MNDRTICQMEIHPELIQLRRIRAERAAALGKLMAQAQSSMYGAGSSQANPIGTFTAGALFFALSKGGR
jgi:hypothetical protein